jgi:hypothetical protein
MEQPKEPTPLDKLIAILNELVASVQAPIARKLYSEELNKVLKELTAPPATKKE